jgi:hypothetical protein
VVRTLLCVRAGVCVRVCRGGEGEVRRCEDREEVR